MQPGGGISPGTAAVVPLGSSWDCWDGPFGMLSGLLGSSPPLPAWHSSDAVSQR